MVDIEAFPYLCFVRFDLVMKECLRLVPPVPVLAQEPLHPFPGVRGDIGAAVEPSRHGRHRDARRAGDIGDRDAAASVLRAGHGRESYQRFRPTFEISRRRTRWVRQGP